MKTKAPTFYEKLTRQRHLDVAGAVTYSTRPGNHGEIICSRPGVKDQRILLVENGGLITIVNLTAKKELDTFVIAGNCCAEELHQRIELFSKPGAYCTRRVIRDRS